MGKRFSEDLGEIVHKSTKVCLLGTPKSTKMQIPVTFLQECFPVQTSETHALKKITTPRCNNMSMRSV